MTERRIDPRHTAAALVLLLVTAVAVRLPGLTRSLGHDEVYTWVIFAARPWLEILQSYHLPNNHIFHTLCVRLTAGLLGHSEWVLRLPALLAGIVTIPVLFGFTRRLTGSDLAGLVASLLLALSATHVHASQAARGYPLLSLLCVVHAWALVVAIDQRRPDRRPPDREWLPWTIAGVAAALATLTVPSAALFVAAAALGAALLIRQRLPAERRPRAQAHLGLVVLGVGAAALAVYAPQIDAIQAHAARFGTPLSLPGFAGFVIDLWHGIGPARGAPAVAALVGAGLIALVARRRAHGLFLLLLLLSPLLLSLAVATAAEPRVYGYLLPVACVAVAAAVAEIDAGVRRRPSGRRWAWLVTGAVVLPTTAAFATGSWTPIPETGYRAAGRWVADQTRPGDIVVVPYIVDSAVGYYARGATVQRLRDALDAGLQRLFLVTRPGTPRFAADDLLLATNITTAAGAYADRYRSWRLPADAWEPVRDAALTRIQASAAALEPVDLGDLSNPDSWRLYFATSPEAVRWGSAAGHGPPSLQVAVDADASAVLHSVRTFRPAVDGLLLLAHGKQGGGYASLYAAGPPPQALQMARPISAPATRTGDSGVQHAEVYLRPVEAGVDVGLYLTVADGETARLSSWSVAFLPFAAAADDDDGAPGVSSSSRP